MANAKADQFKLLQVTQILFPKSSTVQNPQKTGTKAKQFPNKSTIQVPNKPSVLQASDRKVTFIRPELPEAEIRTNPYKVSGTFLAAIP